MNNNNQYEMQCLKLIKQLNIKEKKKKEKKKKRRRRRRREEEEEEFNCENGIL